MKHNRLWIQYTPLCKLIVPTRRVFHSQDPHPNVGQIGEFVKKNLPGFFNKISYVIKKKKKTTMSTYSRALP